MSQSTTTDCALIVMCKRPQPGVGKQRVAQTHGTAVAYMLAKRLLECALEDLSSWSGPRVIAVANSSDAQWASRQLDDAIIVEQGNGNLGERIQKVSEEVTETTERQLFIGIDAPTLNNDDYAMAADALFAHDVVLADAEDGGVVLMGSCSGWPELQGLPWSTERLGQSLLDACFATGRSVLKTLPHADVDFANQFDALISTLADDPRASRRALVDWLQQINRHSAIENAHA
ncbi:MAG: DUF2064 domain-containing protein [Pseudomonadota bacterium]